MNDGHMLELMLSGCTAVAAFFATLWIKGIRDEVRLAVASINEHSNRLTAAETEINVMKQEISVLRHKARA